jgi:hypothetical protein
MLLQITNPREAIIQSYSKPVLYSDCIIYKGQKIIVLKK